MKNVSIIKTLFLFLSSLTFAVGNASTLQAQETFSEIYDSDQTTIAPPNSRLSDPIYSDPYQDLIQDPLSAIKPPSIDTTSPPEAEEQRGPIIPKRFYLSMRAGLPNFLGLEIGGDVHDNVRIRAATQFMFYTLTIQPPDPGFAKTNLSALLLWPEVMLDLYPVASSSFRLSIGAAYVGHVFEVGENANPFKPKASPGTIAYSFSNVVAPSLGFGWDFGRQKSFGVIGSIEFGASWVGKLRVKKHATGAAAMDLDGLYQASVTTIDKYKDYTQVLPWINVTVGYKF